jgi:hypothetical protein
MKDKVSSSFLNQTVSRDAEKLEVPLNILSIAPLRIPTLSNDEPGTAHGSLFMHNNTKELN